MTNSSQSIFAGDDRIAIVDLADELGIRKQTIFKVVKREDIVTEERRESTRGNQRIKTVSRSEADVIRSVLRRHEDASASNGSPTTVLGDETGVFYVIQLEPDHDRERFKVGFTTELEGRLRKHRCSAPFAKCVKSWPCRRTWERAGIDCVTNACAQLHTEVFRAISIDGVVARADAFFSLMPTPTRK